MDKTTYFHFLMVSSLIILSAHNVFTAEYEELLLILKENSSFTLKELWDRQGDYNDLDLTRQGMSLSTALQHGDYRSAIIDDWGNHTSNMITVGAYNHLGDKLWAFTFDSRNTSGDLTNILTIERLTDSFPVSTPVVNSNILLSDSNFTVAFAKYFPLYFWFQIASGADSGTSIFVSNDGSPHMLYEGPTATYLGCYNYSATYSRIQKVITDPFYMDVDECLKLCDGFGIHIMLETGDTCKCGTLSLFLQRNLDSDCSYYCFGDLRQSCGGATGVMSVYLIHAARQNFGTGSLLRYLVKQEDITITRDINVVMSLEKETREYITWFKTHYITITTPMFISDISVQTVESSVHFTLYYGEDSGSCVRQSVQNLTKYIKDDRIERFQADGMLVQLETLPLRCLWIQTFSSVEIKATATQITLYYPGDKLMTVPYAAIYGTYDAAETTTIQRESTTLASETTTQISHTITQISDTTAQISDTTMQISDTTSDTSPQISETTVHISDTTQLSETTQILDTTMQISDTPTSISDTTTRVSDTTKQISEITTTHVYQTSPNTEETTKYPMETINFLEPSTLITELKTGSLVLTNPLITIESSLVSANTQLAASKIAKTTQVQQVITQSLLATTEIQLTTTQRSETTQNLQATTPNLDLGKQNTDANTHHFQTASQFSETTALISKQFPSTPNSKQTTVYSPETTALVLNQLWMTPSQDSFIGSHIQNDSALCTCECGQKPNEAYWWKNMTQEEKEEWLTSEVANIKILLSLDKKNLSSYIRSKTSALDKRPSARSVGSMGIVLLCLVFGVIFLPDLFSVIYNIKTRLGKKKTMDLM